jgi:8-oxo-dGTP diphosphatase
MLAERLEEKSLKRTNDIDIKRNIIYDDLQMEIFMSNSSPRTEYTLGFAFSADRHKMVVITKNRPQWQAGKWNGVGGHIELGETSIQCMIREFVEETGVQTTESDWRPLAKFSSDDFIVHSFYMFSDSIYDAKTLTDEEVSIITVDLNEIRRFGQTNLPWLISLALDADMPRIDFTAHYRSA